MDLQNEKRDHPHLLHSPPSEVEGVRIVVISFRNIAKITINVLTCKGLGRLYTSRIGYTLP